MLVEYLIWIIRAVVLKLQFFPTESTTMLKTALTLAAVLASVPAMSATQPARFMLDVKIDGGATQKKGDNLNVSSISEVVHVAYSLGRPDYTTPINLLDDGANAARTNRQLAAAQARMPAPDKQAEMMRGFEAEANACKGNVQCMTNLANKMAKMTAAWNAGAPAATDNEGSFLQYEALEGTACKPEFSARVRNGEKGQQADVGGPKPFANKTEADYLGNEHERQLLCNSQLVQDQKSGRIFVKPMLPVVKGMAQHTRAGVVYMENKNQDIPPNAEAWAWVGKQLLGAPRSGKARTTLKVPVESAIYGTAERTVNVEMSWSLSGN
jgi:hypothetical protein